MIYEVSHMFVEKIGSLGLSPPIVIGRVVSVIPGRESDRLFIGLDLDTMRRYTERLSWEIAGY